MAEPNEQSDSVMMAFCDASGQVYDHPELEMLAWDGSHWRNVKPEEIRPLPEGSDVFMLPGRLPVGYDPEDGTPVVFDDEGVFAASCFVAPAYLRQLLPAYETMVDAVALPLFAYSALGIYRGELVTACVRVDEDIRQDPFRFDIETIEQNVAERLKDTAGNHLVRHLSRCALTYHCRAAQNYFLDRFEAPLPIAPLCNASCVGCISLQPKGGDEQFPASHDRIQFRPTPEHVEAIARGHIDRVGKDAVVSFGQGCEGEPLMEDELIVEATRRIRAGSEHGVINLNTNASRPDVVEAMCEAGLNSIRISTNSARPALYDAYYRPKGYSFDDVQASARVVKSHGGYVMLNYFVFPGITDTHEELDALSAWIEEADIDMLQARNLNLDPEYYLDVMSAVAEQGEPMGIENWLSELKTRHPGLRIGYFNPPARLFAKPS